MVVKAVGILLSSWIGTSSTCIGVTNHLSNDEWKKNETLMAEKVSNYTFVVLYKGRWMNTIEKYTEHMHYLVLQLKQTLDIAEKQLNQSQALQLPTNK